MDIYLVHQQRLTKLLYEQILTSDNPLTTLNKLKLRYVNQKFYEIFNRSPVSVSGLIIALNQLEFEVKLFDNGTVLVKTPTGFWKQI